MDNTSEENKKVGKFSLYALLACCLLLFAAANFYYPKWAQPHTEATISWDVAGYYLYLPAFFIYGDPAELEFKPGIIEQYRPSPYFDQAFLHEESGNYIFKYSAGMALLYSPAFFAAWLYTSLTDYPADGYSFPFQFILTQWSLLVAFLGLFYLRKFLLIYFRDAAVGLTLVAIVFGTNYLSYASTNGAMSHNFLFTIYALLLWTTYQFYRSPTRLLAASIGLLCGFAALARPTELIVVLIPVLWGLQFPLSGFFKKRVSFFLQHRDKIGISILCMLLVGSVQLIYWKSMSGDWLVYSYEDQGFSWTKPHLWRGFFSTRAGWLTYSPIMAFALIGFVFLWKQQKQLFLHALFYAILVLYITFAWDIWWYGGSLGQRALVQSYAIFAIPMTAFMEMILRKEWRSLFFGPLLFFLSLYNIWWFHQSHRGGLFIPEQMNTPYFISVLGKFSVDEDVIKLLDTRDRVSSAFENPRLVFVENFESESTEKCGMDPIEGSGSLCLPPGDHFSPVYFFSVDPKEGESAIRSSAIFRVGEKEWDHWKQSQMIVSFFEGEMHIRTRYLRLQRLLDPHEEREIYMDLNLPNQPIDRIGIQFSNPGSPHPILVDNLRVYLF